MKRANPALIGLGIIFLPPACFPAATGGEVATALDLYADELLVYSEAGARCDGRLVDLRVGKTFDPGAVRIGKAESATWSNPLSATVVDDAFVLAVVCRLGGRVGWQVAAGLDEEFAQLTATKVRYGTRSAYLLASRARGPGVTCSGELRDPDHRLIKRLAEQRISRQGGVQWGLQVEGLEGYGWVVCRARQFIDVDNFSLERNRITLAQ